MRELKEFEAIILDLDGVVTSTERLHARAWKKTFDDFLSARHGDEKEPFKDFDIEMDYQSYVDGRPRLEGVRSFLEARKIDIPQGNIDDHSGFQSIVGIGNTKNEVFNEFLETSGVHIYPDAVEKILEWKEKGLRIALVSSSRNASKIIKMAGLEYLFEVVVDGTIAAEKDLPGKPAPDTFLYAAKLLKIKPDKSMLIEDSESGIIAGKDGGFGLVVGVSRDSQPERLKSKGADLVVSDLQEL